MCLGGLCQQRIALPCRGISQHLESACLGLDRHAGAKDIGERIDQIAAPLTVEHAHLAQVTGEVPLLHELGDRGL